MRRSGWRRPCCTTSVGPRSPAHSLRKRSCGGSAIPVPVSRPTSRRTVSPTRRRCIRTTRITGTVRVRRHTGSTLPTTKDDPAPVPGGQVVRAAGSRHIVGPALEVSGAGGDFNDAAVLDGEHKSDLLAQALRTASAAVSRVRPPTPKSSAVNVAVEVAVCAAWLLLPPDVAGGAACPVHPVTTTAAASAAQILRSLMAHSFPVSGSPVPVSPWPRSIHGLPVSVSRPPVPRRVSSKRPPGSGPGGRLTVPPAQGD